MLKYVAAAAAAAVILTGCSTTSGTATRAKAPTPELAGLGVNDPIAKEYIAAYGESVCTAINDAPTLDTITGLALNVLTTQHMTSQQGAEAIFGSVITYCPNRAGLLQQWANSISGTTAN